MKPHRLPSLSYNLTSTPSCSLISGPYLLVITRKARLGQLAGAEVSIMFCTSLGIATCTVL